MTDKQIIIDGVDVADCEHINACDKKMKCVILQDDVCETNPYCEGFNCYYKQLKRKEQECEVLRKLAETHLAETINMQRELDQLTEELAISIQENEEGREINAELKAENDKYSLFIEKLCDYAGLECDSEEQAMRTLSDLASQMNKARWIIDKLKQTLTEIKEIAEIINDRTMVASYICDHLDKILQKISEVEEQ